MAKRDNTIVDSVTQTIRCQVCGDEIPIPLGLIPWVAAVCDAFSSAHAAPRHASGQAYASTTTYVAWLQHIAACVEAADIATCEAFAQGLDDGRPKPEQLQAVISAAGALRHLVWPDRKAREATFDGGRKAAAYLRKLADTLEGKKGQSRG
jgi:hypothetical protein